MTVTREQGEQLYAMGYRSENSPLDGPRAVLDAGLPGVYVTLTPDPQGCIHWAVWTKTHGRYVAGGSHDDALVAAGQATDWIKEEWQ